MQQEEIKQDKVESIAIIGVACRFPGANNYQQFWQNLEKGINSIREIPSERWEIEKYYSPNPQERNKSISKWGGFIEDIDQFDAKFFGISPREAQRMDPQQRLMLELSWSCLEDAGYAPSQLSGSSTGVFIGGCHRDYEILQHSYGQDAYGHGATGTWTFMIPNRISFFFNFRGPSVPVDTACSSSLVAVHQAIDALKGQECDRAIVGGVNLLCEPTKYIQMSRLGMLSLQGQCKTFDSEADGYVRGEGAGVILLKPLAKALEDEDYIYGVIRGSAVNHGGRATTLTSPNIYAQSQVICDAYTKANVPPDTISYIEAHGTGTPLGDPIEINGLKRAFRQLHHQYDLSSVAHPYCGLGAVKTNIGHLEAAAGIAGVIKVLLAMKNQKLPKTLNFKQLNPRIKLKGSPFYLVRETQEWKQFKTKEGEIVPRRAGISSFGIGGVNAHIVLEEAPELATRKVAVELPLQILTLSTKNENALGELVQKYEAFLKSNQEESISDICFTTNTGRAHFKHRLAILGESTVELQERLEAFLTGNETRGLVKGQAKDKSPKIAFLFTGQGSQYVHMGRGLYSTQLVFRKALEQCDEILRPYLEKSLLEILYAQEKEGEQVSSLLDETIYTQPALFAIEYALAQLWQSWGIKPDVVMGHSVGEYVAATVSGVFSLEDGLRFIAHRGRLMQQLPKGGAMLSVIASEEQINQIIAPYRDQVTLAAINGPESIVISGKAEAIKTVQKILDAQGIKTKQLQVSHAFHSPLMEPILADFEVLANQITYNQPRIPIISNVTGTTADESVTTAKYWVNHVHQPVKFAQSMKTLHQQGYEVFLEIGPKPILLGMGKQCWPDDVGVWLPSLCYGQKDWQRIIQSLAELYVGGVKVDWSGFDQYRSRSKVVLPTYPFQRERYWIEPIKKTNINREKKFTDNGSVQHPSLPSPSSSSTLTVDLLNQGNTQQLIEILLQTNRFTPEQEELLPEVLNTLVQHHQQQLAVFNVQDWLYRMEWKPKTSFIKMSLERLEDIKSASWMIFIDESGVGKRAAELLSQALDHRCILVSAGEQFQLIETDCYQLNPANVEDFDLLMEHSLASGLSSLTGILFFWGLDTVKNVSFSDIEQAQSHLCGSVLYLTHALTKHCKQIYPKLWIVTRGAQPVSCDFDSLALAQSLLWGMGKVIAMETPELWGGLIDLDPKAPSYEALALLSEISHANGEDHLAIRGRQSYIARLTKRYPYRNEGEANANQHFDREGTYLITGGLGALGIAVAQWLAERGARHLVLTSLSGKMDKVQHILDELERTGTKVLVVSADVSSYDDMSQLFEKIQEILPPLKGIVHSAGIAGDEIALQNTKLDDFIAVLQPKVTGTWLLHELTLDLDLDFFVSFSSIAAVWGAKGLAPYATANHFMDVLSHYRQGLGLKSLSINWGPWSGGGMATEEFQERLTSMGVSAFCPEQALAAFRLLLESESSAQIVVADVDWHRLKGLYHLTGKRLLDEIPEASTVPDLPNMEKVGHPQVFVERLSRGEESNPYPQILSEVHEIAAQILRYPISKLSIHEPLTSVGVDSLTAVELKNSINGLGFSLSLEAILKGMCVEELANEIVTQINESTTKTNNSRHNIPNQFNNLSLKYPKMNSCKNIHIKILDHITDEIISLRRDVYVKEKCLIEEKDVITEDDKNGVHVCIYSDSELVAAMLGVKAVQSYFQSITAIPSKFLENSFYVTRGVIKKEYRAMGLFEFLIYLTLREGRKQGKEVCVNLFEKKSLIDSLMKVEWLDLDLSYSHYKLYPGKFDIEYGLSKTWDQISSDFKELALESNLLLDDIALYTLEKSQSVLNGKWFQKVKEHRLTKKQYIESIANNYQYVQWTTRLLARIASITSDSQLRNHYLKHLSEEIDHEKIVEQDLQALDADVEYIKNTMVPNTGIGSFMCTQESLASFRNDPVTFLSIPIAIECLTANLGTEFIKNLHICAKKWGIENPTQVTRYLYSHIHYDGGNQGHWENTLQAIKLLIKSEKDVQVFRHGIDMVLDSIDKAYNSFVEYDAIEEYLQVEEKLAKAS